MTHTINPLNARSSASVITNALNAGKEHRLVKQNDVLVALAKAMGFDNKNAMQAYAKTASQTVNESTLSDGQVHNIEGLIQSLQGVLRGDKEAHRHVFDKMVALRNALPSAYLCKSVPTDHEKIMISIDPYEQEVLFYTQTTSINSRKFWPGNFNTVVLTDEIVDEIFKDGIVTGIRTLFPRADKYGAPANATYEGAKEYFDSIGIYYLDDFIHVAEDTGDDGGDVSYLEVAVPQQVAEAANALMPAGFRTENYAQSAAPESSKEQNDTYLNLTEALEELEENPDFKLYEVEIGLFDMEDDPNTPFETHNVVVCAESKEEANEQAQQYCEENIAVVRSVAFAPCAMASEVSPEDF